MAESCENVDRTGIYLYHIMRDSLYDWKRILQSKDSLEQHFELSCLNFGVPTSVHGVEVGSEIGLITVELGALIRTLGDLDCSCSV